jgi:hypothetical protein
VAGAFVLAGAGTAQALSVPGIAGGPTFFANRNVDNGTAYIPTVDFDRYGEVIDLTQAGALDNIQTFGPDGAVNGEDTWGLFIMYRISDGIVNTEGLIDDSGFPTYYDNSPGDEDTWLVGMFYGGNDYQIKIDTPAADQLSTFEVWSEGVHAELWAVEASDLDLGVPDGDGVFPGGELVRPFDENDRLAANEYAGWLDATTKANGAKLFTATSTHFKFTGSVDADGKFTGDSVSYWDIDETDASGLWNGSWGLSNFFTDPDGNTADIYTSWELIAGTTWDTVSRDFGGVNVVVPEPVTMLGMFLAVGSLGGYIRKRRMA